MDFRIKSRHGLNGKCADGFNNSPFDEQVSNLAVVLSRKHHIKLPDAIVWASAQVDGRILIIRNTKDFAHAEPGVRILYQI